jgi:hypothetical protein
VSLGLGCRVKSVEGCVTGAGSRHVAFGLAILRSHTSMVQRKFVDAFEALHFARIERSVLWGFWDWRYERRRAEGLFSYWPRRAVVCRFA